MMNPTRPFSLAVLLLVAQGSFAQTGEGAGQPLKDTYDLRISEQARAILVEAHQSARGKVTVKQGPTEISHAIDHTSDVRWLDEVGAPGGSATHHRRTFLQFQTVENGRIQDPGLEGACLLFSKVGEEVSVEARAPRQVLKSLMRRQAGVASAIGLHADFAASVEIGASFAFEGEALLATMIDIKNQIEDFKATLKLDRVDAPTQRAFLSGSASFSSEFETNDLTAVSAYEGTLSVELDLAADTIASVTFAGTSTITGRGKSQGNVEGLATFEATASSNVVTSVNSYRVKKPAFRENTHVFAGAQFKLPSCWMPLPQTRRGIKAFLDSRSEGGAAIEIARTDDQADPSDDLFIDGFLSAARKEAPDIKVKKATFPIGDGITFELTAATKDKVRGFVAPVGKGLVRVRLLGSADAVRKSDSELRAIQESLAESDP